MLELSDVSSFCGKRLDVNESIQEERKGTIEQSQEILQNKPWSSQCEMSVYSDQDKRVEPSLPDDGDDGGHVIYGAETCVEKRTHS